MYAGMEDLLPLTQSQNIQATWQSVLVLALRPVCNCSSRQRDESQHSTHPLSVLVSSHCVGVFLVITGNSHQTLIIHYVWFLFHVPLL